ncbi:MAG: DUF721 domain-containing protein [Roseinatronobacter sp.]
MTKTLKSLSSLNRRMRGFEAAARLVEPQIRKAGETRGFAVSRLLTHWAEVAGPETAACCRPVKISYGKGGLGATLTLLTTGAAAPTLQMELPKLRERVNACYGYNAIARITITQTAPTGFAEGQASFSPAPKSQETVAREDIRQTAQNTAQGVQDAGLRSALERLACNVLSKARKPEGKHS